MAEANPRDPEDLYQYVVASEDGLSKGFKCGICYGLWHKSRSTVRNHVEAIHFPATFSYSCDQCGTTVRSKNALNIHVTKNHRNKTLNQVQPYDTMQ